MHRRLRIYKFGRAGNKVDRPYHLSQPLNRAHHLKAELRDAVAKISKWHHLKNDIGGATISGSEIHALFCHNKRVGGLRLVPFVNTHGERGEVDFFAISPNSTHRGYLPFAERNSKICVVGIGGDFWSAALAASFGA